MNKALGVPCQREAGISALTMNCEGKYGLPYGRRFRGPYGRQSCRPYITIVHTDDGAVIHTANRVGAGECGIRSVTVDHGSTKKYPNTCC